MYHPSQSGLFSGVITAFIIDSYKNLSPDSGTTTVALLARISEQLAAASNGSHAAALVPTNSFQPTWAAIRVNILWFFSLALALTCALAATLVQQWARNYLQAINRRPAPHKKGVFMYRNIITDAYRS